MKIRKFMENFPENVEDLENIPPMTEILHVSREIFPC
jgi:hypothetical protein